MGIIGIKSEQGFTLTELMIAMVIGLIVLSGVYSTYIAQQKSYNVQTQITFMNQNLRAGMYFMEREIRMAGYDPTGNANVGITSAGSNSITFSMDLNGDGDTDDPDDTNEVITYSLYVDSLGVTNLGRSSQGGSLQPVAENIDALNFVYLDKDGNVTATLSNIRSVQITMVARAEKRDPDYVNNQTYSNQQGTVIYTAPGDNYRRNLLTAEVKCRNLGLR